MDYHRTIKVEALTSNGWMEPYDTLEVGLNKEKNWGWLTTFNGNYCIDHISFHWRDLDHIIKTLIELRDKTNGVGT